MNWRYLGIAALLPLVVALGLTLTGAAVQAIWLNRKGGSSRAALLRLLRTIGFLFPLAFLAAALWDGRNTWRGLIGTALGHPVDQRAMGLLYAHGEGFLARNPAKAALWFRKAAEGGDAGAQLRLAQASLQGYGLPKDPEAGLCWARAAADQGLPDAMVLVGDLLRDSGSVGADSWYQRALTAFQVRIQAGDAEASLACGLLHAAGKGVPKDPVEGLAWMYLARRMGLNPFMGLIVQLTEAPLTKPQREQALQRAHALQKSLFSPP